MSTGQRVGVDVNYDVTSRAVLADGSTAARTLAHRFSDTINANDYGVVGDGTTDDTAAIQAAVDAAIDRGCTLHLPDADIRITDTIVLQNCKSVRILGHGNGISEPTVRRGTRIVWDGDNASPAFLLDGAAYCDFEDFYITTQAFAVNAAAQVLFAGFVCQNGPTGAGQILATANRWKRVFVYGRQTVGPTATHGWRFTDPGDGRSTGLNEGMIFDGTVVQNFTGVGYYFGMAQSAMNRFFGCAATSYGLGGTGWMNVAGANFHVYGGSAGSNAIDFFIEGSSNNFTIQNFISEGSSRFLESQTDANSTAAPVVVINSTFNDGGTALNADGKVIKWQQRSLVLVGFTVKGSNAVARAIDFDSTPNGTFNFVMVACSVSTSHTESTLFSTQRPSVMFGCFIGTGIAENRLQFQGALDLMGYDNNTHGRVTIAGASTAVVVAFDDAEPNTTSWSILAVPDAASKGGAAIPDSARMVSSISKTTGGFTLSIDTAPGASNIVGFRWMKVRGQYNTEAASS